MQRCWTRVVSDLAMLFGSLTQETIANPVSFNVRTKRSANIPQGKAIIERIFLILGFAMIFLIFFSRYMHLRSRGRNTREFFSFAEVPETPNRPSHLELPRRSIVTTLPRIYNPQSNRTQTRGLDIDIRGRRIGCMDGDFDEKDRLPAYDNNGGPPRYLDVEMGLPTITTPTGHDNGDDSQMSTSLPSYGGIRPPEAALRSSNM